MEQATMLVFLQTLEGDANLPLAEEEHIQRKLVRIGG
jgi:hypothetical protein